MRQYNPPANFAKDTDTRFADYVAQFGHECWELDALPPDVLIGLYEAEIQQILEPAAWDTAVEAEAKAKQVLASLVDRWGTVADQLQ